jgi:hypothetical protein
MDAAECSKLVRGPDGRILVIRCRMLGPLRAPS